MVDHGLNGVESGIIHDAEAQIRIAGSANDRELIVVVIRDTHSFGCHDSWSPQSDRVAIWRGIFYSSSSQGASSAGKVDDRQFNGEQIIVFNRPLEYPGHGIHFASRVGGDDNLYGLLGVFSPQPLA